MLRPLTGESRQQKSRLLSDSFDKEQGKEGIFWLGCKGRLPILVNSSQPNSAKVI
jgi:hypothetical protein